MTRPNVTYCQRGIYHFLQFETRFLFIFRLKKNMYTTVLMKPIYMLLILLLLVGACSSDSGTARQAIESRPIESMNQREASLLGLDLKSEAQDGWPTWTGSKVYTMQEAQSLASENGKKVLVEVYAVWCGYCRKMAAETHPDAKVKQTIDELFYLVRLDAESDKEVVFNGQTMTESELAAAFGVSSFPTTVFVDTNGDPLGYQPGFMDATTYSFLTSYVGSDAYKTQSFEDYVSSSAN